MTQKSTLVIRNKFANWRHRKASKELFVALFTKINGICPECNNPMILNFSNDNHTNRATWDHIIPLSITMTKIDPENLRVICRSCNLKLGYKFNQEIYNGCE